MDEYVSKIREYVKGGGIHVQNISPDGNDFYQIVADELYGIALQSKTRKQIYELEKKYSYYFRLFLPVTKTDDIHQENPLDIFMNDLKPVLRSKFPPSPRELFAASELLRRRIFVFEFQDAEEKEFTKCSGYVYSPILRSELEDESPLYICMLRTNRGPNFVKIYSDQKQEILNIFQKYTRNMEHVNCIGNRFLNTFNALHDNDKSRETRCGSDLFGTLSFEIYGTYDYSTRVMNLIFNFQTEDNNIEIFSKFLDENENLTFKEKKQFLLRHQDMIREERNSSGQAEIFAAISVFNIQLFLEKYQSSGREFYLPLSGHYNKEFQSYLSLKQSSERMFCRSDSLHRVCSCVQDKPEVRGKLGLLKCSVYSHLALEEEWSLTMSNIERHSRNHDNHKSLSKEGALSKTDEHDIPVFQPHSEIRLVMRRGDMKDRVVEELKGQDVSLWRCISKEIFESEDKYEYLMEIVSIEANNSSVSKEEAIQSRHSKMQFSDFFKRQKFVKSERDEELVRLVEERQGDELTLEEKELDVIATYFQTKVYVLKIDNDNTTRWYLHKPYERETIPTGLGLAIKNRCPKHEFYITLYKSTTGQYHRIVPNSEECNCGLRPPDIGFIENSLVDLPVNESRMMASAIRTDGAFGEVHRLLREWFLCSKTLQQLCDSLIIEIEERRFKVNIATITGSSVGFIGASIAIGGLIAAPFTMGVSTTLMIAGGVVAGVGGVTATGAKIGESVLNTDSMKNLKINKVRFHELSSRLEESIDKLIVNVEDFDDAVNHFKLSNSLETFDKSRLQSIPGLLQTLKGFAVIPFAIMRLAIRMATILGAIIGPLSALLDIGFLAFSAWNIHNGCNTDLSDSLRRTSAFLVASRKQMHLWAFGNEIADNY